MHNPCTDAGTAHVKSVGVAKLAAQMAIIDQLVYEAAQAGTPVKHFMQSNLPKQNQAFFETTGKVATVDTVMSMLNEESPHWILPEDPNFGYLNQLQTEQNLV